MELHFFLRFPSELNEEFRTPEYAVFFDRGIIEHLRSLCWNASGLDVGLGDTHTTLQRMFRSYCHDLAVANGRVIASEELATWPLYDASSSNSDIAAALIGRPGEDRALAIQHAFNGFVAVYLQQAKEFPAYKEAVEWLEYSIHMPDGGHMVEGLTVNDEMFKGKPGNPKSSDKGTPRKASNKKAELIQYCYRNGLDDKELDALGTILQHNYLVDAALGRKSNTSRLSAEDRGAIALAAKSNALKGLIATINKLRERDRKEIGRVLIAGKSFLFPEAGPQEGSSEFRKKMQKSQASQAQRITLARDKLANSSGLQGNSNAMKSGTRKIREYFGRENRAIGAKLESEVSKAQATHGNLYEGTRNISALYEEYLETADNTDTPYPLSTLAEETARGQKTLTEKWQEWKEVNEYNSGLDQASRDYITFHRSLDKNPAPSGAMQLEIAREGVLEANSQKINERDWGWDNGLHHGHYRHNQHLFNLAAYLFDALCDVGSGMADPHCRQSQLRQISAVDSFLGR